MENDLNSYKKLRPFRIEHNKTTAGVSALSREKQRFMTLKVECMADGVQTHLIPLITAGVCRNLCGSEQSVIFAISWPLSSNPHDQLLVR